MSSNGIARDEQWPQDDSPASKRRRIAFSCLACRRRKLKCDRIYPSCSRCQKGGHPEICVYDAEAVESRLPQGSEDGQRGISETVSGNHNNPRIAPRLSSITRSLVAEDGENPSPRGRPLEDIYSRLYRQEAQIRQLEDRIHGLEKAAQNPPHQWPSLASIRELSQAGSRPSTDHDGVNVGEPLIFKGKHFKTQFFGASHPTSFLSHVC